MDNRKFTTLKEQLEQIRKGSKYRLTNNRRLKKLALKKQRENFLINWIEERYNRF